VVTAPRSPASFAHVTHIDSTSPPSRAKTEPDRPRRPPATGRTACGTLSRLRRLSERHTETRSTRRARKDEPTSHNATDRPEYCCPSRRSQRSAPWTEQGAEMPPTQRPEPATRRETAGDYGEPEQQRRSQRPLAQRA
jgi:hypothetical protein